MIFHHERDSAILPVIIGPALQNKICPRVPSLSMASLIVLMILFKTELNLKEDTLGFSFKCVTRLIKRVRVCVATSNLNNGPLLVHAAHIKTVLVIACELNTL